MDTILTKTKHPLMTRDYCGGVNYSGGAMMGGGTVGNPGVQPYKYGTKELDRQNGLDWYDSQARHYDPLLGRTPTMDPLSEKYYSISPYAYCAGNPILFVDPTGMALHITGANALDALQMLTERFERAGLQLEMDVTGNVTYKTQEGKKLSKEAKRLMEIIDDESIRVNISTTNEKFTSEGDVLIGGAFMGNTYNEDGSVDAYQEVNVGIMKKGDRYSKKKGSLLFHEITECYEGAVIAQQNQQSTELAINKISNPVYDEAHSKASPQPIIRLAYYGVNGREIHNKKGVYEERYYVGRKSNVITSITIFERVNRFLRKIIMGQ